MQKESLNVLVNKKIATVTRLREDNLIIVEFTDGILWSISCNTWGELAWEIDEIVSKEGVAE